MLRSDKNGYLWGHDFCCEAKICLYNAEIDLMTKETESEGSRVYIIPYESQETRTMQDEIKLSLFNE